MSKIIPLTVPKWGMAMEEGTLVNWLVEEGDALAEGADVAELESSKIVNVLQTHFGGTLRRKTANIGDTLPVGALLAVISEAGVADTEIDAFVSGFQPTRGITAGEVTAGTGTPSALTSLPAEQPRGQTQTQVPASLKQGGDDSGIPATPHARRMAQSLGINLNNVKGSGRNGRVSELDIERVIIAAGGTVAPKSPVTGAGAGTKAPGQQSVTAAPEIVHEIPMAGMRETIARRLQESKRTVPHYRLVADASVDALFALRGRLNQTSPDARITVNDMLIRACALALMAVPECNIQFEGGVIRRFRNADISVAVALDGGLITPIVRNANFKSFAQIASETRDLTERAKMSKLKTSEYAGGTLTISNLGMYGIRQFDAIINPPQAAVLAVGRAEPRAVARDGKAAVATMLTLSLSCDHRVIDGALAARFLQHLTRFIEAPESMS
ncbi:MAG: 2-oxo acid dehydrogenase subunit E2 [Gammaproteobacteria bacterium]|nr:2-oxo acid dehydrogenase subunit E2 [Gammaproteobacteria bacterium]